ncbi:hypothetical protein V8D89_016028 [Ganoderma adspersum]
MLTGGVRHACAQCAAAVSRYVWDSEAWKAIRKGQEKKGAVMAWNVRSQRRTSAAARTGECSPACAARSADGAQLGICSARQPHQLLGKPGVSRTGRVGCVRGTSRDGSGLQAMLDGGRRRGSEGGSVARKACRAPGTWLRGALVGMAGRMAVTKRPQADSVAEERSELRGQLTDGTQTLPCGHENAKRGTGGLTPRSLVKEGGLRGGRGANGRLVTDGHWFCPWTPPLMIYDTGRQGCGAAAGAPGN